MAAKKSTRRINLFRATYDPEKTILWEGLNHPRVPWIAKGNAIVVVQLLAEGTKGVFGDDPAHHEHYVDVRVYTVPK